MGLTCRLALVLLLAAVFQAAAQTSTHNKGVDFSSPTKITFEAENKDGAICDYGTITATFSADGSPITNVACDKVSGSFFSYDARNGAAGTVTEVTCTGGRQLSPTEFVGGFKKFVITVKDSTPPTLVVPSKITAAATGPKTPVTFIVTTSDACDPSPSLVCDIGTVKSGSNTFDLPKGLTVVSCTSTDNVGNKAGPKTFEIEVVDDAPPKFLNNGTLIVVEANGADGAIVDYAGALNVVAEDVVDLTATVVCDKANGGKFPLGDTPVVCTASDSAQNKATLTITVRVVDTTPPVITKPDDVTVEAQGPQGAVVVAPEFPTVTATDAVTNPVVVTTTPPAGSTFPLGATPVRATASDNPAPKPDGTIGVNNAAPVEFVVRVVDTTPPEMPNIPKQAYPLQNSQTGVFPGFSEKAIDLVDGPVDLSCTPPPGTSLPLGTHTVHCTAVDKAGNPAAKDYEIEIIRPVSVLTIRVPDDTTFEADLPGIAGKLVSFSVSANDNLPALPGTVSYPTITCTKVSYAGTPDGSSIALNLASSSEGASSYSATNFPSNLGITKVSCTATNRVGATATKEFTITVADTTPPSIVTPDKIRVKATSPAPVEVTIIPVVSDIVDQDVTVSCDPPSGTKFAITDSGAVITCTAVDDSGNKNSTKTVVEVYDDEGPVCTAPVVDPVQVNSPDGTATVNFAKPKCEDAVYGTIPDNKITCTPASGGSFAVGSTTVTCVAEDPSGNKGGVDFPVTVIDGCKPTISTPQVLTVEATGPSGATVEFLSKISASDCKGQVLDFTCNKEDKATFPLDDTKVTCTTAPQYNGATATGEFKISVIDTTPPKMDKPADIVKQSGIADFLVVDYPLPASVDLVDGVRPVTCTPAPQSKFSVGNTTVTCTSSDTRGNTATVTFTIVVQKDPAPAIVCPASFSVEPDNGKTSAKVKFTITADSGATVACSAPGVDVVSSGIEIALGSSLAITCTATKASGAKATCSFTASVADKTPCTICKPKDITLYAVGPKGAQICENAVSRAPASDNAGPPAGKPALSFAPCNWPNRNCFNGRCSFPVGSTTITCATQDYSGNACNTTFVVRVLDNVAPCISVCSVFTVEATSPAGAPFKIPYRVYDNVDGTITDKAVLTTTKDGQVVTITAGYIYPLGATKVTITAVDTSGNKATQVVVVSVVDTTPPKVYIKEEIIKVPASGPTGATVTFPYGQCTGEDIVTPVAKLKITTSKASGALFPIGRTCVACEVKDEAGNKGVKTFTVEVESVKVMCRQLQSCKLNPFVINDVYKLCKAVDWDDKINACRHHRTCGPKLIDSRAKMYHGAIGSMLRCSAFKRML